MTTLHENPRTARIATTVLMLAFALIALAGCSEDSSPTGPGTPAHANSNEDGGLRITAGTDKASYGFGEIVTINLTLTNISGAPMTLDFDRGNPARYPNLNVNVDDSGGSAHYVDGDGTADQTTLAAGASISYRFDWDQTSRFTRAPVDRGVHEVIGFAGFDDRATLKVEDLFIELK